VVVAGFPKVVVEFTLDVFVADIAALSLPSQTYFFLRCGLSWFFRLCTALAHCDRVKVVDGMCDVILVRSPRELLES
jgi:hypothetical protein